MNFVDHNIFYRDCSLDIFEQIISTSELVEKLVKRELLIFRKYQLDVKDIKCLLQWWQKHETMFPTVGFLARQILGIVGSQIEIERIFSLAQVLTMGIVGSQIEIERIFSLAQVLTMGIVGSQIETEKIFSLVQILSMGIVGSQIES